jgi:2-hydroxy-3-keto-5-methylthiopentenyl-1-phosphate phosphatase
MVSDNSQFDPKKCIVFFDFDNTIATCDVFDNMLLLFSKDDRWVELEKKWKSGKIGSKTCLEGQLRGMDLSKKSLDAYLPKIKLDPYFKPLYKFLLAKKVKTLVLSDNYDYILNRVFKINRINKLKVYANKLNFIKDKVVTDYPYKAKDCQICAHCKTKNLQAQAPKDSAIIYVGDGESDTCPAKHAQVIFAKDHLLRHLKENKPDLDYMAFHNLKDVFIYLKRKLR